MVATLTKLGMRVNDPLGAAASPRGRSSMGAAIAELLIIVSVFGALALASYVRDRRAAGRADRDEGRDRVEHGNQGGHPSAPRRTQDPPLGRAVPRSEQDPKVIWARALSEIESDLRDPVLTNQARRTIRKSRPD